MNEKDLKQYLQRNFPIKRGRLKYQPCNESDEILAKFEGGLFSDGQLVLRNTENCKRLVIFLTGSLANLKEILGSKLCAKALSLGYGFASWEWPLQGKRWKNRLFPQLKMLGNVEKEYARILPLYGVSLFELYLNEFAFILKEIEEKLPTISVDVVGWSQGAHFSWYAPVFNKNIKRIISCGSFAPYHDLVAEGNTHVHGYPYFHTLKVSVGIL